MIVKKKDSSLCSCLDPKHLNEAIQRERYQIPTIDDILPKLVAKNVSTIIDMKERFWNIELDESSSKLCTFSTPYRRFSFKRQAFGIKCAPELFQKRTSQLFGDIPGVGSV